MRGRTVMLLTGVFVLAIACDTGGQDAQQAQPDTTAGVTDATTADGSTSHDAHDAAQSASGAAADGHAHGGTGEPRSLLAIMQQLGTDMVSLTHGLMTDSAQLVAQHAEAIANHAPIAQDDLERIHQTLGEEMQEFERMDEDVHEAAVRLHEATESDDIDAVLTRLNEVQRGCVACHTQFRDRLRTNTR